MILKNCRDQQDGPHLLLTNEDWRWHFPQLKLIQIGVLMYVRTLDPRGEGGLDLTSTAIAKELGVHRSSVSRAVRVLAKRKFIEIQEVEDQWF